MLSETYNKLMKEGVVSFADNMRAALGAGETPYTLFYPTIGKDFGRNRELVVYGQAVNGWKGGWTIGDIPHKVDAVFRESFGQSLGEHGKCPLAWVNEDWVKYGLFRSFFWNVTYKLVKAKYGRTDENWNHILAWSNLAKIAPSNHANPSRTEFDAQLEHAARLFTQELDEWRPKHALLITNMENWAGPILRQADIPYRTVTDSSHVLAVAHRNETRILITGRPYVAAHSPFVQEVMRHMS